MIDRHLSAEQIALLDTLDDVELVELVEPAELAEPDDGETVTPADREHLRTCAACAGLSAELAGLGRVLRTAAEDVMPPEVVAGLSARLAAEASTVALVRPAARAGAASSPRRAGPARRHTWLVQAAAGVSVLALGVALAVGALRASRDDTEASGGAASGSVAAAASAAPAAPAAPSVPAAGTAAAGGSAARDARFAVTSSGTAYTASTVPAQVARLLADADESTAAKAADPVPSPVASAVPSSASSSGASLTAPSPAPLLAGCVEALGAGPDRTPVLVDSGTWQGRPATLVVLRWTEDPRRADAYVVEPTCRAGASGSLFYAGVQLP